MARQRDGAAFGWRRRLAFAALAVAAVAVAFMPYLPAGPDLYVHLLWSWEVMRSLAAGVLPVWLPDLNAGFGSPGIRLYSPLGPFLQGVVGLGLGGAGAALRVVPVLVFGVFLGVVLRRRGRSGWAEWAVILASPPVLYSLLGRGAWSEFLAVPLLWWLLDAAVEGDLRPVRDGVVLGALWLLHAPTTLTALVLMAVLAVTGSCKPGRLAAAAGVAAGLTAWHWLPLQGEMRLTDRASLTGGIFNAAHNVLGSATAHALDENIWLGWCALALVVAALVCRCWRSDPHRTAAVIVAITLASPLSTMLYRLPAGLGFVQFPGRWLLPATVLAALPLCRAAATAAGRWALVLVLAPLLLFPLKPWVRDPGLAAGTSWGDAGRRVYASFGGNPMIVDAAQNRPEGWRHLAANVVRFGTRDAAIDAGAGTVRVVRWAPLERVLEVSAGARTTVALRLLDYPFWRVRVDGVTEAALPDQGAVAVDVPRGRHTVEVEWAGNPLARAGLAIAAATALALAWGDLRSRRRSGPGVSHAR